MAANAAGWRLYLVNTLLLSNDQATAFIGEGYDTHDSLREVSDDTIVAACRSMQRPGGLITNPAADPANPNPNIPANIPAPGIHFGSAHQTKLKMLAFWCTYIRWTNRNWNAGQATVANLTKLYAFKQELEDQIKEDNPKFPEKFPDKIPTGREALTLIEDMNQWISNSTGNKFPLSFVVRPDITPFGTANDYPIENFREDLAARVKIRTSATVYDPVFLYHNRKVCEMVYHVTHVR